MRRVYVQESIVRLDAPADGGALGAAITVALCGHWSHPPPCPLAPHNSATVCKDEEATIRTVFATEPENAAAVRGLIESALRGGHLEKDGKTARWQLLHTAAVAPSPDHQKLGERLNAS